jgi:hypothetical protein
VTIKASDGKREFNKLFFEKPFLFPFHNLKMSNYNHAEAVEELQKIRMTNERCSEQVTILGARLIKDNYTSKLGDQSKKSFIIWLFLYTQLTFFFFL